MAPQLEPTSDEDAAMALKARRNEVSGYSENSVDPQVSVVVAAFNRGEMILPTLRSVLSQTFENLAVIVVDDASTDDTCDWVSTMDHKRVRLIRHEINRGVASAYNTGILASKSPLIAFLDHDDLAEERWIESLASKFLINSSIGMAWGEVCHHYADGSSKITFLDIPATSLLPRMLTRTPGATGVMLRREVVDGIGLMDPEAGWLASREYSMRFAVRGGWDVHCEPHVLLHKYATGRNLSEITDRAHVEALLYLLSKHRNSFDRFPCSAAYYLYMAGRYAEINGLSDAMSYLASAVQMCPQSRKYRAYLYMKRLKLDRFWAAASRIRAQCQRLVHSAKNNGDQTMRWRGDYRT